MEKEKSFPEFKAYLLNIQTRELTLDLDNTNEETARRLCNRITTEFNVHARLFRTRRGHFHVEASFSHSLLDNILIRCLCGDDGRRIMFDVWRMFSDNANHNVLFVRKLTLDVKANEIKSRPERKLLYVSQPQYIKGRLDP